MIKNQFFNCAFFKKIITFGKPKLIMKKNYLSAILLLASFLFIVSCDNKDDYQPIDDLPIATDDTVNSTLTTAVEIPILDNDTTGDEVVPTSVSIINGVDTNSNGTLDKLVVASEGTWQVNASTGTITFTPLSTFVGNPTPIKYTVKDAENNVSNEANVTINALPIVSVDLTTVPYPKLSDYNFFVGDIKDQIPSLNVLPYEPASALFSDYAHKKRFVWMPEGTHATYNGDGNIFEFPVGAALVKTFYYENVIPGNVTKNIETRLLIRKSDGWKAYTYVWNESQTDALLETTNNGLIVPVSWTENSITKNVNFKIPAQTECITCHKINPNHTGEITIPIGPKPQNINTVFNYTSGSMYQIQKWKSVGYLGNDTPETSQIYSTVDWRDTSKSLELRARSYIDMNCAHCHREGGHCDYVPQRFDFSNTNLLTFGVCLTPLFSVQDHPFIINAGDAEHSIMVYRMNTNEESQMMPIIGRTTIHTEGVQLIKDWINSLSGNCH